MYNSMTPILNLLRPFCIAVALCGATAAAPGVCGPPSYRVGRTWADNAAQTLIDISIPLEDFAPDSLICLAGALRRQYPERSVKAYIFSSYEAAMGFVPGDMDLPLGAADYQFKLHGIYAYDKETQKEYLKIDPDGYREWDPLLETRIDLPVTATPVCRLGIAGRCLLEFRHIYYPNTAGNADVSGRVTVTGRIRRDGTVSGLAVAGAEASPPDQRQALADFASSNLGTWRFEPGKRDEAVRITYYFEVADSRSAVHEANVEFGLPNEVRVWTARSH